MGSPFPSAALLTADSPAVLTLFAPRWGIFWQGGAPALVADSVASVDYSREYDVSSYSQEQGAFESYNKVQQPFESKVTLLSSLTRQQLLNILEPTVASLALVSVVTPEVSYPSANLTRYSLRRTQRSGVSLISVDVHCKEIRVNATTSVGGTQRPIGQVAGGSSLVPGSSASANPTTPLGMGLIQPLSASATTPADLAAGTGAFTLPPALGTGSTNAATPTQSGPVQATSPADSSGVTIEDITIGPLSPPT